MCYASCAGSARRSSAVAAATCTFRRGLVTRSLDQVRGWAAATGSANACAGKSRTAAAEWPTAIASRRRVFSSSAGAAEAGQPSFKRELQIAAAGSALVGFTYLALAGQSGGQTRTIDLKMISEDTFEYTDNLFVFFLDEPGDLLNRQEELQRVMKALADDPALHRLRFFYSVRKEEDPPLPEPGADQNDDGPNLRVMMYKGQRKSVIRLRTGSGAVPREQIEQVLTFYAAKSQKLKEAQRTKFEVPLVSNQTFEADVVDASSPEAPVLLQMYEDTCFLCFLMRPFVNSLAKHMRESGIPLRVKRLNLEKNDFPDGCPVARGTPTFAIFRGPGVTPAKWDEFKPNDVVTKIKSEYPGFPEEVYNHMDDLQNLVSSRLQLFTQVVMWSVELQKLEKLLTTHGSKTDGPDSDPTEDDSFGTVVTEMMLKDMKRQDGIRDNLLHLQKEVDELEHDASILGASLAKEVISREGDLGLR